jgi:ADP-ribosylation factor related protein 1
MRIDKIPPTVGLNIAKIERRCGEFTLWDVGGQSVLRKLWDKYYGEADCLIFVIDGADSIRFEEV